MGVSLPRIVHGLLHLSGEAKLRLRGAFSSSMTKASQELFVEARGHEAQWRSGTRLARASWYLYGSKFVAEDVQNLRGDGRYRDHPQVFPDLE